MAIGISITVNSLCVPNGKKCLSFAFLSFDRTLNPFDDVADHFSPRYFPSRRTQHRCSLFAAFFSFVRSFFYFNFDLPLANDDGRVQAHTQRIFEMFQFQRKHGINYEKFLDNLRVVDVENYMQLLCL